MNYDLKKSVDEAEKIIKKYPSLNNIIFDDWRGWRFIYDTKETRNCQNDCQNCDLFNFLKIDYRTTVYTRLIKAKKNDQIMFGPEKFLNCKSFKKYQDCYIYFILNKIKTETEIQAELDLLMGLRVIYSSSSSPGLLEYRFKVGVIRTILARSDFQKRKIIRKYLNRQKIAI